MKSTTESHWGPGPPLTPAPVCDVSHSLTPVAADCCYSPPLPFRAPPNKPIHPEVALHKIEFMEASLEREKGASITSPTAKALKFLLTFVSSPQISSLSHLDFPFLFLSIFSGIPPPLHPRLQKQTLSYYLRQQIPPTVSIPGKKWTTGCKASLCYLF